MEPRSFAPRPGKAIRFVVTKKWKLRSQDRFLPPIEKAQSEVAHTENEQNAGGFAYRIHLEDSSPHQAMKEMVSPIDGHLDLNGLRLHFLDWGNRDKQPLLLLHGFMAHAHIWDESAMILRAHYHVIALDQRGHGESQWSAERAYTLSDHFLDISALAEAFQWQQFILLGHSMGGRNALFYAACSPAKVRKLILVDARPGNNPAASAALRKQLILLPLTADSLDEVGRAIQTLYPSLSREICRRIARYGYQQEPNGKYVPKYDRRMSLDAERAGCATEDLWPFLKNIRCPTLIVRGGKSPFLSLEDAQRMSRLIPLAEWKEIPQATHLPMHENPNAFETVVHDFLDRP